MLSKYSILLFPLILFTSSSFSQERFDEKCTNVESSEAEAFWDFNRKSDKLFPLENGIVKFHNRHSGILPIPDTDMFGIKFHFKGKWPDGDSTSEWRYTITEPQSHIFEYMKIYQPKNYYHRLIVEVETNSELGIDEWNYGDRIISDTGNYAIVAKAFKDRIYIESPDIIYDKAWGNKRLITNKDTGSTFISDESTYLGANNKLSAMWQGKYSNAAMVVETLARSRGSNGEPGNGYCHPIGSKSTSHGPFGEKKNFVEKEKPATCFDVRDNGSIIELVIERKRATNLEKPDGVYRIWKRSRDSDWSLIFSNTSIPAYQENSNYFTNGYIFGWSNSGYKEDTNYYLLGWSLWNMKPYFLP